ncbi:hypothetical protein ACFS3C_00620 [Azotobacter vinelandii]
MSETVTPPFAQTGSEEKSVSQEKNLQASNSLSIFLMDLFRFLVVFFPPDVETLKSLRS